MTSTPTHSPLSDLRDTLQFATVMEHCKGDIIAKITGNYTLTLNYNVSLFPAGPDSGLNLDYFAAFRPVTDLKSLPPVGTQIVHWISFSEPGGGTKHRYWALAADYFRIGGKEGDTRAPFCVYPEVHIDLPSLRPAPRLVPPPKRIRLEPADEYRPSDRRKNGSPAPRHNGHDQKEKTRNFRVRIIGIPIPLWLFRIEEVK